MPPHPPKPPVRPRLKIGDWVEIVNPKNLPKPISPKLIGEQALVVSQPEVAHRLNKNRQRWKTFWVTYVQVFRVERFRAYTQYYRLPVAALTPLTRDPEIPLPQNVNPYHTRTLTKQQFARLWELHLHYLGKNGAKRNDLGHAYLTQILEHGDPPLMCPPTPEIALAIRKVIHPCTCPKKPKTPDFNCPFHGPNIDSNLKSSNRTRPRNELSR